MPQAPWRTSRSTSSTPAWCSPPRTLPPTATLRASRVGLGRGCAHRGCARAGVTRIEGGRTVVLFSSGQCSTLVSPDRSHRPFLSDVSTAAQASNPEFMPLAGTLWLHACRRGGPRVLSQLHRQPRHLPRLVPAHPEGGADRVPRPGKLHQGTRQRMFCLSLTRRKLCCRLGSGNVACTPADGHEPSLVCFATAFCLLLPLVRQRRLTTWFANLPEERLFFQICCRSSAPT